MDIKLYTLHILSFIWKKFYIKEKYLFLELFGLNKIIKLSYYSMTNYLRYEFSKIFEANYSQVESYL